MIMNLIRSFFTCSFILLLGLNSCAQRGIDLIDTLDLKRHLNFIASDKLQGRSYGTPVNGLEMTAGYIQSELKKLGVKESVPGYFQPVPLVSSKPDSLNSYFEVKEKNGEPIFKTTDLVTNSISAETDLKDMQIVFAGFGWRDSVAGYNDFAGLDLKGKLVMVVSGTPDLFLEKKMMRWNSLLESKKVKYAIDNGAAAVCVIITPVDTVGFHFARMKTYLNRGIFRLMETGQNNHDGFEMITSKTANSIPGIDGKLNEMLTKIASSKKPGSFELKNARADLKLTRINQPTNAKNVLAVVEGSDPVLRDECIVFMAHYDHLGIDKNGDVFNGADDNGSGTVTLLELAQAFQSLEKKPARSIVFLWVTGEELGLLGSEYYTMNPLFPIGKTKAAINIDMDGRVLEPRDSVWNKSPKKVKDFDGIYAVTVTPTIKELNSKICSSMGLVPDYSLPAQFLSSSDHFNFHNKAVPVLNLSTGYHADYHKVTDEISHIRFDKMKRVADLCFLLGIELANQKQ